jgi:hypothetical protein
MYKYLYISYNKRTTHVVSLLVTFAIQQPLNSCSDATVTLDFRVCRKSFSQYRPDIVASHFGLICSCATPQIYKHLFLHRTLQVPLMIKRAVLKINTQNRMYVHTYIHTYLSNQWRTRDASKCFASDLRCAFCLVRYTALRDVQLKYGHTIYTRQRQECMVILHVENISKHQKHIEKLFPMQGSERTFP